MTCRHCIIIATNTNITIIQPSHYNITTDTNITTFIVIIIATIIKIKIINWC